MTSKIECKTEAENHVKMVPKLPQNGAKIDVKTHQKIIENSIDLWEAIMRGQVTPNRLHRSEQGCRGGVGEGSVDYVYSIIGSDLRGS